MNQVITTNVHFFTENEELNMALVWNDLCKFVCGLVHYISSMSIGQILVNPTRVDCLAVESGPSMGQDSSLRTEGDGMLSGALF